MKSSDNGWVGLVENSQDVLELIYRALRAANMPEIDYVSIDGDNHSSSIVITCGKGINRTAWFLSSENISQETEVREE